MNAEKYTQKALEAVKTAQNMAQENGNQYVTTEHLLYALLDQDGGLIGSLFGKMGVDCDGLLSELDTLIRNLPRISGGSGEVYASPEVGKILNLAEKTAEKLHDEYLSVEHLMLAIFSEGSQSVRQLLSDHGITRSRFSDELASMSTVLAVFENILAVCMDTFGWSRKKAVFINGLMLMLLSLPCVFGYNIWSDFHPILGKDVLDSEDFLVSNLLLPIGSLVYLLFCVMKWGWGFDKYLSEVNKGTGIKLSPKLKPYFQWVLPILIVIILLQGLL